MFGILDTFFWYVITVSILVFVHELGHYSFAKLFGIKVEQFSIGFGKELIGFNDRSGTRWKLSLIPFGGYVKLFGDFNPLRPINYEKLCINTKEEAESIFFFKPLWQKALVVFSGPLFNFLFATAIIMGILLKFGYVYVEPVISEVVKDSPAHKAGIKPGDRVEMVDGKHIKNFAELQYIIFMNVSPKLEFQIKRENELLMIDIYPEKLKIIDEVRYEQSTFFIGILANDIKKVDISITKALKVSTDKVIEMSRMMLKVLQQMIYGQRAIEEISGPIKIANYSKHSADAGYNHFLSFLAVISINLGIINLLPIPTLDGGYLMLYAIEALSMRRLPQYYYVVAMRVGFTIMVLLMIFVLLNDLKFLIS